MHALRTARVAWRGAAFGLAAILIFGAGLVIGRGVHPKLWFGIKPPVLDPSSLEQVRQSAQLHDAVYFFGDSQMEGFATANIAPNSANFGIAGDNSPALAARLADYHFAGAHLVVIEAGINDWGRDRFADFATAYPRMLAAVPAGVPVVALAMVPPAKTWAYDASAPLQPVTAANATVRTACAARPGCRFVEPPLAGPDGYLRPEYVESDGEHLSAAGYAVWRAALAPQMPPQM